MRHQWLTPTILGCVATLAIAVSGPPHPALHWVSLRSALQHREQLRDGHLRVVLMRAAHALGILPA